MTLSRRTLLQRGVLASLTPALLQTLTQTEAQAEPAGLSKRPAISDDTHFLSRVTWGARPEDHGRLAELGWEAYLETQLDYPSLPDPQVEAFLSKNKALGGDIHELRAQSDADYSKLMDRALWARLYRAAYSERQLFERMVELWTDHFNIPIPDLMPDKIIDDREVVRAHALGRFGDLLRASAMSPAMLEYLSNASSHKDYPNENYGRELLELHTLGVDGGYTEADVKDVARAFTGWTLHDSYPGRFYFRPDWHDEGEKVVLGRRLAAGRGIEDGLEVLDLLAHHPATARFIALKLGRTFVEDEPPEHFITSTARVFLESDGDLKATVRHVFSTEAFWAARGNKYRRPLEALVAMMRALPGLSVRPEGHGHFIWALETMGHKPFHWFPPNGYPNTAPAWISTNGLLNRWNVAMVLPYASEDWLEGVTLDLGAVLPAIGDLDAKTVGAWLEACSAKLRGTALSHAERRALCTFVSGSADPDMPLTPDVQGDKSAAVTGLLLASARFQWS